MGVEYYLICKSCKKYVDLHKAYKFMEIFNHGKSISNHPQESLFNIEDNSSKEGLGYWAAKGIWFLSKHIGHEVFDLSDYNDDWWEIRAYLEEQLEEK